MSKELVVSSNRHETRVAILEDDQVVEVYFQRENEYSLAGSIHKGKVTRVLPGMQSAFVDIGLERDAFLYVSDFFEDNEEYDKIVTSVEEKILKLDKDKSAAVAPSAPGATARAPEPEAVEPPAPTLAGPVAAPAEVPPREMRESREPRDGRDGRDDRRGRRRGRRRGPKGGRGLPESKFYSPGREPREEHVEREREPAPEPVSAAPSREPQEEDDFLVLPGESLAKYTHSDPQSRAEEPPAEADPGEPMAEEALAETVEAAPEIAEAEVSEAFAVEEEDPELSEPEPDTPQGIAEAQLEDEGPLADDSAQPESDWHGIPEALPAEEGEAGEPPLEPEAPLAEAVEEEGPEPARIPTSLTATLREQNPRYLHRVSRRMRRRGRGGEPQPRGAAEPAPRIEPRAEPPRTAARPEPREKSAQPSITDLLREGQEIIVQIAKEPLGQKGARITSHIALPGRFLVYMPTVDHIGVSRKIASDEERSRLKRILQQHHAGIPGGFIVRTAGEGHSEEELRTDMMFLYNLWMDLRQRAEKKPAPALVHHDLDVVERTLRDQLNASFKSIWVDNEEVYENVLRFVQRFQPALVGRVKLYTRPNPIFDEFSVTQELEKALRPKVWLKSGGYIVINQTEALVAIDVNTGKYVGKSNRLEDTIVKTNTDAIKEIVRQIRLRDLGGIIVVDFIDMDERKNRQKVMQALEEAMRSDRAPYKILQFNDFGLVAITRKRVKQSLERTLCSPCPYCEAAGYVKSVQTVIGEILQEAQKLAKVMEPGEDAVLRVNPEVAKVLKSSRNTFLQEIEETLSRNVLVKSDPQLHQEKFDLA